MANLRTPLPAIALSATAAIALSATCACTGAGAVAVGAVKQRSARSAATLVVPTARAAHVGAGRPRRPKHARLSCHVKRGVRGRQHQVKRGVRGGQQHGKHRGRCTTLVRTKHRGKSLVSRNARSNTRSGYDARPPLPRLRAQSNGAAHAKRAGKGTHATSTVVTLGRAPATVVAATIASVLAAPCQNSEIMPRADNLDAVRTATLCLVNQERARNNELPFQPNSQLEQAAQSHSEAMVSEDYFAHTAPNGETQLARVTSSGYIPNSRVGYTIGENIAWGTLSMATPSSIVAAWIGSPEHLANMLNGGYRDSAIGVVAAVPASLAEGQPGAIYTQEFGVISG